MATLNIEGKRVTVSDDFLKLSPEQQQATVEEIARSMNLGQTDAPDKPERGLWDKVVDNVVGRDDGVESPGEKLGTMIRGGTAAVSRGMADVPALPANLAQLAVMGVEKAFGMEKPSAASRALSALPDTREMLASVPVIGPESEFKAPGKVGEYISTAGEFAGGAGLAAGPGAMVRYGAIPGVASEAAGQATAGTSYEPYARAAAALAAPSVSLGLEGTLRRAITPNPGIDPVRKQLAGVLDDAGIPITAGQRTGAENLRLVEGSTSRGQQVMADQADEFTRAALAQIGVNAKRATPEVLKAADDGIGAVFEAVTRGVQGIPEPSVLTKMSKALEVYRNTAPKGQVVGIFNEVNKALVRSFRSRNPIPMKNLLDWRSQVSRMTVSPDPANRAAARVALDALDGAIDNGLRAAGRPDAIGQLNTARSQWRDFLAIESAASRAGEGTALGILSPSNIRNAVVLQGKRSYTQGTRGGLADLSRAAEGVMKPLPTVNAGGARVIQGLPTLTGGGIGASAGAAVGGPAGAAIGGALGAAAPGMLANQMMRPTVQRYLANQLVGSGPSLSTQKMRGLLPGLLSQ